MLKLNSIICTSVLLLESDNELMSFPPAQCHLYLFSFGNFEIEEVLLEKGRAGGWGWGISPWFFCFGEVFCLLVVVVVVFPGGAGISPVFVWICVRPCAPRKATHGVLEKDKLRARCEIRAMLSLA